MAVDPCPGDEPVVTLRGAGFDVDAGDDEVREVGLNVAAAKSSNLIRSRF